MDENIIEIVDLDKHNRKQAHAIGKAAIYQHWSMFSFLIANRLDGFIIRVAMCDGEVAGYAAMVDLSSGWRIGSIAVAETHRNKGIGTQLIEDLADIARSRGAAFLLLEVRESSSAARHLYSKMGFVEEKIVPRYYKTSAEIKRRTGKAREDAIVMRMALRGKN